MVMCHELAHNNVSAHNEEHEVRTPHPSFLASSAAQVLNSPNHPEPNELVGLPPSAASLRAPSIGAVLQFSSDWVIFLRSSPK